MTRYRPILCEQKWNVWLLEDALKNEYTFFWSLPLSCAWNAGTDGDGRIWISFLFMEPCSKDGRTVEMEGVWFPGDSMKPPVSPVSSTFRFHEKQIASILFSHYYFGFSLTCSWAFPNQSKPIYCLYKKAMMIHLKALYSEYYLLLFPTNQITKRPIGFLKSLKMFFLDVLGIK